MTLNAQLKHSEIYIRKYFSHKFYDLLTIMMLMVMVAAVAVLDSNDSGSMGTNVVKLFTKAP